MTVVPIGRLSFLDSGLEDAVLMMCFLEAFSWFAIKIEKEKGKHKKGRIYVKTVI